jgi:chemotaxis protein methyltransferase CheR
VELDKEQIEKFTNTLKSCSEYDFTQYSEKSLSRRLAKILHDGSLDMGHLIRKIIQDREFLEKIVKDITVNTTEMFRDPAVWHSLRYDIIPRFDHKEGLRIWHPGCSTGQEVYSMMILLNELGKLENAQLFGSDINSDVLVKARKGTYKYRFNVSYLDNFDAVIKANPRDPEAFNDVPYDKYFHIDKTRDNINMHDFLVEKAEYKKMDLVMDTNPFDKVYDLIICRNVIIYFNYELQNKVFKLFLDNMTAGACLVLGVHETILGPYASYFEKKYQAYFKK